MKIRAITITNFRSFIGTQTFRFPEAAGLYFLWGENRQEPRLDANGSGKTSLWEALYWCFFGATSSGLKASDVANWEVGKKAEVKVELWTKKHGIVFVIRTWSPNSWVWKDLFGNTVDLAKDDTNPLTTELRLTAKPFLSCVMMAQGQRMFLDLEATEKAALFAEVMDLDRWLRYSQRSSDLAREEDTKARACEAKAARLEGQLEQLHRMDTATAMEQWESNRELRLEHLERRYKADAARSKAVAQDLKAARETLAISKHHYAAVEERVERQSRTCSKCGQPVHNEEARLELRQALQAHDDVERRVRALDREIALIEKDLDAMEHEEARILAEENPHADADRRRAAAMKEAEAELAHVRADLSYYAEQFALHNYWVRWFKEIRLGLIAEALRQLEIEVNSCVNELGLVGWELFFDVDKETKSGTISRGFSVTVRAPHGDRPVPWKAWSGGESQRLRIATNMGLSNLIRSRTSCGIDLEVWDEATQWLSGQGVQDLLDALRARAEKEQRQIWVVDHRTLGYAGFSGSAGVIKGDAGSVFDLTGLPA